VISLSDSTTRVAEALQLGDRLQSLDPRAPDALAHAFASGADVALADAGADSADVRAAIASRNIAVRVFSPTSTQEVLAAYTEIATVLGKPKAAAALIDRVTRELTQSAKGGARPRVALVVSRTPLRVVAGDAFLSHLLELAGVDNVFAAERGVTVVMRPEQLEAKSAERALDVPQAALAGAWVDPVSTVRSLQGALASSH
jgi:ABC-type hemin transport system substrate-binding protein